MQIIWYGHSCFILKLNNGKRILIDPFENTIGYKNSFPKCDLITISHSHFDHSHINDANKNTEIINTSGLFDLDYVKIEGFTCFHDNLNGLKRGSNIIYIYNIDNYRIAHLGDIGHIPSDNILKNLCNIDLLLIPIDENFCLSGVDAYNLSNMILPKYIIPIHYKTFKTSLFLDDCKSFITKMKNVTKINSNIVDLTTLSFDKNCNVLLLTPCK